MTPTICSFYTQNPASENGSYYADHANRLREECAKLNLATYIHEQPYQGSWISTLRLKPLVILKALDACRGPVLWLDVDGSIMRAPREGEVHEMVDLAGVPKKQPRRPFFMGCLYFGYTLGAIALLEKWNEIYSSEKSEELAFGKAVSWAGDTKRGLITQYLPPAWMCIVQANQRPPADAVIIHRLSSSPSKAEFYRWRRSHARGPQ